MVLLQFYLLKKTNRYLQNPKVYSNILKEKFRKETVFIDFYKMGRYQQ